MAFCEPLLGDSWGLFWETWEALGVHTQGREATLLGPCLRACSNQRQGEGATTGQACLPRCRARERTAAWSKKMLFALRLEGGEH